MSPHRLCRRRVLEMAGVVSAGALAGCADGGGGEGGTGDDTNGGESDDDSGGGGTEETDPTEGSDGGDGTDATVGTDQSEGTGSGTPTKTPGTDELDRREANVVGVEFEGDGGSVTFEVTLHHDDDGEEGYANWWQVERPDGTRLGRRELRHAHSKQPFTRSATVDVPADVTCVVVRGHDQTHGYGGRGVVVDLGSGATRSLPQGSEPQPVAESDCP